MRFLPCLLFTFELIPMPGEAWACGNAVELSRSEVTKLIADARAAIDAGDALAALRRLDQKLGWQAGEYSIRSERLQRQVDQIYAVAKSRDGGSDDVRSVVQTLRDGLRRDRQNPWLRTRLADALSRTPGGRVEALTILTGLAEKDLIVDAEGYAVLARLRQGQKDEPGAKQALAHCSAMARRKEISSSTPCQIHPASRRCRRFPLPCFGPGCTRQSRITCIRGPADRSLSDGPTPRHRISVRGSRSRG